jgi:hypothetical protein
MAATGRGALHAWASDDEVPTSAAPAAFKTLEQTSPRMFTFMAKQVEPTVAALLAVQAHDMKTNTGFSCFNCHSKK